MAFADWPEAVREEIRRQRGRISPAARLALQQLSPVGERCPLCDAARETAFSADGGYANGLTTVTAP